MSNMLSPMPGPGNGVFPANGTVNVRNVTATAMPAGSVVMMDLAVSDGDTLSLAPGHTTSTGLDDSIFCNVVLAAAALDTRIGQFLITVEAIAAGAVGKAAVTGIATGNVRYGLAGCTINKGGALIADTVSGLLIPAPAWSSISSTSSQNEYIYGQKIVGYAMLLTLIGSGSATNLTTGIPVWFNGMGGGWGNVAY